MGSFQYSLPSAVPSSGAEGPLSQLGNMKGPSVGSNGPDAYSIDLQQKMNGRLCYLICVPPLHVTSQTATLHMETMTP